jgi:hypothetical protein
LWKGGVVLLKGAGCTNAALWEWFGWATGFAEAGVTGKRSIAMPSFNWKADSSWLMGFCNAVAVERSPVEVADTLEAIRGIGEALRNVFLALSARHAFCLCRVTASCLLKLSSHHDSVIGSVEERKSLTPFRKNRIGKVFFVLGSSTCTTT